MLEFMASNHYRASYALKGGGGGGGGGAGPMGIFL